MTASAQETGQLSLPCMPEEKSHTTIELEPTGGYTCAKRTVVAIIFKGKRHWIGINSTDRHVCECPKTWEGEPFDICAKTCGYVEHAEIAALRHAGKGAKGGVMYIIGHHFACKHCFSEIQKAGIKSVVYGRVPPL